MAFLKSNFACTTKEFFGSDSKKEVGKNIIRILYTAYNGGLAVCEPWNRLSFLATEGPCITRNLGLGKNCIM